MMLKKRKQQDNKYQGQYNFNEQSKMSSVMDTSTM
jgi:hypothetical protein